MIFWIFRKDKAGTMVTSHQKFHTHAEVRRYGHQDPTVWKIVIQNDDETEQIIFQREESELIPYF